MADDIVVDSEADGGAEHVLDLLGELAKPRLTMLVMLDVYALGVVDGGTRLAVLGGPCSMASTSFQPASSSAS